MTDGWGHHLYKGIWKTILCIGDEKPQVIYQTGEEKHSNFNISPVLNASDGSWHCQFISLVSRDAYGACIYSVSVRGEWAESPSTLSDSHRRKGRRPPSDPIMCTLTGEVCIQGDNLTIEVPSLECMRELFFSTSLYFLPSLYIKSYLICFGLTPSHTDCIHSFILIRHTTIPLDCGRLTVFSSEVGDLLSRHDSPLSNGANYSLQRKRFQLTSFLPIPLAYRIREEAKIPSQSCIILHDTHLRRNSVILERTFIKCAHGAEERS